MKILSSAPALLVCGALALLAGCASEPESHVLSAPPPSAPATVMAPAPAPVVVATQNAPGTPPGSTTYIVTQAPPAPQVQEVAQARPSSQHVWVEGYYTWRNNRYEWMAGHWEVPPRSGAVWVVPRYEREGNSYRFYEGYWN